MVVAAEGARVSLRGFLPWRRRLNGSQVAARDALRNLLLSYPHREDLTVSRTIGMLYLVAWRLALVRSDCEIDATWRRGKYGPISDEALEAIYHNDAFVLRDGSSPFGRRRTVVEAGHAHASVVPDAVLTQIAFVVAAVAGRSVRDLSILINGTYPMRTCATDEPMLLRDLAGEYQPSGPTADTANRAAQP